LNSSILLEWSALPKRYRLHFGIFSYELDAEHVLLWRFKKEKPLIECICHFFDIPLHLTMLYILHYNNKYVLAKRIMIMYSDTDVNILVVIRVS